jgi:hypothetical protein
MELGKETVCNTGLKTSAERAVKFAGVSRMYQQSMQRKKVHV